ncbi:hypothetical protein H6G76_33935 [Nostoc sp. FACHB-152]|uniref:hypothetical protein n=1 Tax=unclassified Nostoc TaxID=2593658 RepID=UPI00168461FB|nr:MULTISPECIES: hypothetical protein [unclassified Nostoc]MBD2452027.1 hypothetical protein [Nostoc sp. FACHB-152]MBD2473021.1 hypothetical protein [Nostoc sp. FACHB-145]
MSTTFRRPDENGLRVQYYRLKEEDVAFAKQVLAYRQRQREEREDGRKSRNIMRLTQLECRLCMASMLRPPPPLLKMEVIIGGVGRTRKHHTFMVAAG